MKCGQCGKANPQESRYCNRCGAGLQGPGCDLEPHTDKTTPRLTPEAERKHITALFSDLSGYTAMTEKLDPEQVKEITGRIFSGIKKIVTKYEGFIERVMGDGVLAFFGVPHSHEDDPIRAIQAALEIHNLVKALNPQYEALVGAPLTMHSGINTGLVVTADVDPEKGTHGIAGDAVNVASRLSSLAGPGEICVGEETVRRAKGRFVFDDLGPQRVKGKADPINVFKVISVKVSAPGIGTDRHVSSEMVGRDKELDRLELQVMKVINGEGSVVNVVGEAGIGKSRLIAELRKREVMKKVTLLEGRAISIGRNLSFHPIIDLLKQWAGIAEDDSENKAFDKLERAIRAIHPDETNEILPFLATLMGMKLRGKHAERVKDIAGESLEKLIFKNLRELIITGSELRPTVVVMEDLHWADASSLGLLESLSRLAENHRLLFINLFRPGYWQPEDHTPEKIRELLPNHHVEIAIQPLDKETSQTLVGNMLDIKGLPYSLLVQVSERAGGNPFFIEEVVRSLIDDGAVVVGDAGFEVTDKIHSVVIPPTINDVLMARIDRLEERTRELVKVASVIGRSFFDRILKDVATSVEDIDTRLEYLKDVQLIRDRTRMEELEYLFKHALAQEVAYESTLLQQRKALHLKVAQSIERIFRDRLHEFYGILAWHYSKAEDPEKAEEWMTKAGEEALRSSASSEALYYYKEALRLYLDKYGTTTDPEKLAIFEKNIALAYVNRGHYPNAAYYFDKVFLRWGRRSPTNQISIMAKLAYDFPIILFRLYLPWTSPKRIPDKRVNEFFDLALKKDRVLTLTNPRRCFTETIGEYRESLKYDLTMLDAAAAFHLFTGGVFAYAGFFRMGALFLGNAKELIDHKRISDVTCYQSISTGYNYLSGNWSEIPEYDKSLFNDGINNGLFWDMSTYSYWLGSLKIYQGEFGQAKELVENFDLMEKEYQFGPVTTKYMMATEMLAVFRRLHQAKTEANNTISLSVEKGVVPFEFQAVGWKAVTQVLLKDFPGAKDSLTQADEIRGKQALWIPFYIRSSLIAQFMLDLHLLEDAIGADSRSLVSEYTKAALKSGKAAVKNSGKFAAHRTWNYQLMGKYYWLIGKQRKALKWFDKSIKEGERLGARPDLSRTYMEVGKCLLEPKSKYKELNGISATAYLEKAETMFKDMDLEWDLEELERVRT
jgi:class 3 adenylate cyclase